MRANKRARDLLSQLNDIKRQMANLEVAKSGVEFELREMARQAPDKRLETSDQVVTYVQSTRVTYNLDTMRAELSKEVLKSLVDEEYVVDKVVMRELLDDYPKLRSIIKPALKKVVAVNQKKVEEAHAKGIVSTEELRKCSTVQTSEYIRTSAKEKS